MKTILNSETKELRRLSRIYLLEGLFAAGMFHIAMIGGVTGLMRHLNIDETIPPIRLEEPIKWIIIGGADTPVNPDPGSTPVRPKVFVNNAVPVIVPVLEDAEPDTAKPEETYLPDTGEPGEGDPLAGTSNLAGTFNPCSGEVEKEPEPFTIVEREPVPILNPSPKYPELAMKAGIEGTVFVKMWVTKDGSIKRAEVMKSTSPIFDQEAVSTAMRWKFTPAIMNAGPVSVWVTVPFRFHMRDR